MRHRKYSDDPTSYIADWNATAPYPAMLREEIESLRAQLAEAQAALKTVMRNAEAAWMPEAVPPEPCMKVIATYVNSLGNRRTIMAKWIPGKTEEAHSLDDEFGEYDEATDTTYVPEGWYECINNLGDYTFVAVSEGVITHWMPLPEAPDAIRAGQAGHAAAKAETADVVAKEMERCIGIIESHHIPVGNSAAGEMACEWTYDALKTIRAAIRAGVKEPSDADKT